jgi:hypothetical protein
MNAVLEHCSGPRKVLSAYGPADLPPFCINLALLPAGWRSTADILCMSVKELAGEHTDAFPRYAEHQCAEIQSSSPDYIACKHMTCMIGFDCRQGLPGGILCCEALR